MKNKIVKILVITGSSMIILGFIVMFIQDFYNDYQCSTSQDINWFMENNCMKYVERDLRRK